MQQQPEPIVNTDTLSTIIDKAFEERASLDLQNPPAEIRTAVQTAIDMLDRGTARVAEKAASGWVVNQWLKKAVLLHFGIERNVRIEAGFTDFYDKVPMKYANFSQEQFAAGGARGLWPVWRIVCPPASGGALGEALARESQGDVIYEWDGGLI